MGYKTVDVTGDGSCFFRSIYQCLKSVDKIDEVKGVLKYNKRSPTIEDETDFVKFLRTVLSKRIQSKDDMGVVQEIYAHLSTLDEDTYNVMLESSFPDWFVEEFKTLPAKETTFRNKIEKAVKDLTNWAGQLEITLTQQLFSQLVGIHIHIFNHKPAANYRFKKDTIYLLNVREVHYNAIIPATKKSISVKSCPEGKIINPLSGRCVLKSSCIGLKVLVQTYDLL